MNAHRHSGLSRARTALATATFVSGGIAMGFLLGGLGGRLVTRGAMGWDQLGDVLGGVSVGMALGAVLTLGLARRISVSARVRWGVTMLSVAALALAVLSYAGRA